MSEFDFDLRYVNTCLGALRHYVTMDDLYYPLGLTMPIKVAPYPPLTPGNLLFYMTRLRGGRDSDNLNKRLADGINGADEEFGILLNDWAANWNRKVLLEINIRMRQWENYLDELARNYQDNAPHYKNEARTRAILDLLIENGTGSVSIKTKRLLELDEQLKRYFHSGKFIWNADYAEGFKKETFWYLWGGISN